MRNVIQELGSVRYYAYAFEEVGRRRTQACDGSWVDSLAAPLGCLVLGPLVLEDLHWRSCRIGEFPCSEGLPKRSGLDI